VQRNDGRFGTRRRRAGRLLVLAALVAIAAGAPAAPEWAYPGLGADSGTAQPPASAVVRLAGSAVVFHHADFHGAQAIDWFPQTHPPAPAVVLHARGNSSFACGYCHLPDGRGRPENARLQGLPADYIVEQVKAFANGTRRAAVPYIPTQLMAGVAHDLDPADLKAAADYFSQFEPQSHTRVVESATLPAAAVWRFVYRFDARKQDVLGARIVEGPVDGEAFELRDPETRYIAYVPKGAIARGRIIAEQGASGGPACVGCHGPALAGIAGASPSYLARQLMNFRSQARADPDAAPMQAVAAHLSDSQIIDAAAYIASRRPWTRAEMPGATMSDNAGPVPQHR
jgi:cytochrome c553